MLLESPLEPVIGPEFERCVEDLWTRGYRVLLAHPERAPGFRDEPGRRLNSGEITVASHLNHRLYHFAVIPAHHVSTWN